MSQQLGGVGGAYVESSVMFRYSLALLASCALILAVSASSPRRPNDAVEAWLVRFRNPPREYSVIPFWFWNDELDEKEILRQIDDFADHGVYGFVIHPRIGLPESIGFMSERYLRLVKLAVERAASKGMVVHLYDEGMYPSGSACGQVVKANPKHAARCLIQRPLQGEAPKLEEGENLVATAALPDGKRIAIIDAPSLGKIRGIHFGQDDGEPNQPPAADLLNPEATASFIRLVHEKYRAAVGRHFGKTVRAIFTDEPDMLGRRARRGAHPWTTGLEKELQRTLGYDPVTRLSELWFPRGPESEKFRRELRSAINRRLEETYYAPLSRWCEKSGIALTGHPAGPGEIGVQRYFQIPGQDIVWRYVEPGKPSALEGDQSTTAKCSSSAAAHLGRKRNGNEVFGAYGWNFTYREMEWLTNWLFVRGVNQITPHAFYYSLRGKRRDERPPDVGPNSAWWPHYKRYADYARRMSWLLAESEPVVSVAILAQSDYLPWRSAKACFESQVDFEYLDERHLIDGSARVGRDGIRIQGRRYTAVIVEEPERVDRRALKALGRLGDSILRFNQVPTREELERLNYPIRAHGKNGSSTEGIRCRRMRMGACDIYLVFNEGEAPFTGHLILTEAGEHRRLIDPMTAEIVGTVTEPAALNLQPHQTLLIVTTGPPA